MPGTPITSSAHRHDRPHQPINTVAINREETEAHPELEITHTHLNDHTVAGIRMKNKDVFSVQYHPEASPGPHDADYLFDQFFDAIKTA